MLKKLLTIAILGAVSSSFALQNITIGTGGLKGTYYPTGETICKFFETSQETDISRCTAVPTKGSFYNINALITDELDFGIAQSDLVYHALRGKGQFQGKKLSNIRSVMAIYPELLSLVVRDDSNIQTLDEIKGKRINLGNLGSGNETTVKTLFHYSGIKNSDLLLWDNTDTQNAPEILQKNNIDGYFYMVGHPAKNIIHAQKLTSIHLVPIEGDNAQTLIEKYPYYAKGYIPANTYEGITTDINSIGVKAVLVTTHDMNDETVQKIIKSVIDNFEQFKQENPAYKSITKKSLLEGISAPLHQGAKEYYKSIDILD